MRHSSWQPLSTHPQVQTIARDLLARLRQHSLIQAAIAQSQRQAQKPAYASWTPASVAQGDAGLAVLSAYADACFPAEEWDREGHFFLGHAQQAIQQQPARLSLFGGLCGVAFAGWLLSRNGTRYSRMLAAFETEILWQTRQLLQKMHMQHHGFASHQYDVVTGISGIGAYLLCRRTVPAVCVVLHELAAVLIAMTQEEEGLPHWYTPAPLIMQEHWKPLFPDGLLDAGLAHGVAGPLALLALLKLHGEAIDGLEAGIERLAGWLALHQVPDAWGVNWGAAYPVGETAIQPQPTRCAWCYGAPGIARALWLAGQALHSQPFCELALAALESVYRKPIPARRIDTPGFCHGIAGLLQITLRFAHECDAPFMQRAVHDLLEQVVALYRPETLLGYSDLDQTYRERPDLLNGVAGVALTLLAATHDQEPIWDRLFLLS